MNTTSETEVSVITTEQAEAIARKACEQDDEVVFDDLPVEMRQRMTDGALRLVYAMNDLDYTIVCPGDIESVLGRVTVARSIVLDILDACGLKPHGTMAFIEDLNAILEYVKKSK